MTSDIPGELPPSKPTVREPKRDAREFLLFVLCGGLNTALAWGFYLLLLRVVSYRVAYTLSYCAGICISYYLNAVFVFKQKLAFANALRYPLVYLVQYIIGIALMYVLVERAGVSAYIAPGVIVVLTIPVTYQLSRYATRHRTRPSS